MDKPVPEAADTQTVEHFDVLIPGAGISGIGAAYHLSTQCPDKTFAVLEMNESFGGTWWTHSYPGTRSDSDLFTFGYRFKYWDGPPIGTRQQILRYLGEVIDENRIAPKIRYRHKILSAHWSSDDNLWTVEVQLTDTGETRRITCNFLWMCQGYYNHEEGYTPRWKGIKSFKGIVVHPQKWPKDLAYDGKRVIVIGSGATAATLIPSIAENAAHVTMLQRSPTYYASARNADVMADQLRELDVDRDWIHAIMRKKYLADRETVNRRSKAEPEKVREELMAGVREQLGNHCSIDPHFNPRHLPWRQRVCYVPDGDLFQAIKSGKASVVTDEIECFEEKGIRLKSGVLLEANIVVTATGFSMSALGGIQFSVDGQARSFADAVGYRGMMFTGFPNMVWIFGYARWSWTLRVDLVSDFVCRLLKDMDRRGRRKVEVALRPEDSDMPLLPWFEENDFNPGYVQRGQHLMPRQGVNPEWRHTQDYMTDRDALPAIDLDEPAFRYS